MQWHTSGIADHFFQQVAVGELYSLLKLMEKRSKVLSCFAVSEVFSGVDLTGINKGLIDAVVAYEEDVCK